MSGAKGGLLNSILESPSLSINSSGVQLVCKQPHEAKGSPVGSRLNATEECNRACGKSREGFLQPALSGKESFRGMETCSGRLQTEQVCFSDQVQDGDAQDCFGGHQEERLDGFSGLKGCLFPHSHQSQVQEIPQLCVQRPSVSFQGSVLWPQHCPAGIHQNDVSNRLLHPSGRVQDPVIPGRLADSCGVRGSCPEGEEFCDKFVEDLRNDHQFRKVSPSSNPDFNLSWDADRYPTFLGFSNQETSRQSAWVSEKISRLREYRSQGLAPVIGPLLVNRAICSRLQTEDASDSVCPEVPLEEEKLSGYRTFGNPELREEGIAVVESLREAKQRCVPGSSEPVPNTVLRRLQHRLGSSVGTRENIGHLVIRRTSASHKRERTFSCMEGLNSSGITSTREDSSCLWRQHHSPLVHKEAGRHQISLNVSSVSANSSLGREDGRCLNHSVHSGEVERLSRSAQSQESSDIHRVVPASSGMSADLETLGETTDRSFRHESEFQNREVLFATPGSSGSGNGRFFTRMVKLGPLCLLSFSGNKEGSEQAEVIQKLPTDPHNPVLAKERLVHRSMGTVRRKTQVSPSKKRSAKAARQMEVPPKPPHATSDRMETVHGFLRHSGYSREVASSIIGSKQDSTNALYQRQWSVFRQWCRENGFSASRVSLDQIGRFFRYLRYDRRSAVSTIKTYRSMLATTLRHVDVELSNNRDMKDVIRSFEIEAPVNSPNTLKWNLDVVLKFLTTDKFEPIGNISFLELSKKTLFLVALALAKRVGELQALSSKVGFSSEGAVVSYLQKFRAKNHVSCKGLPRFFVIKQLEQLVPQEEEALLCPVRALKTYLKKSRPLSRDRHPNLFCAVRHPELPMSKNAISFMLRTLVIEAHQELREDLLPFLKVKPHEVRAVATSVNFQKNLSIDEVVSAAQWKCASVFAGHYLRDVELTYEECRTLGPIVAAGAIVS